MRWSDVRMDRTPAWRANAMAVGATLVAGIFYASLAALVYGAIARARASIERARPARYAALALAAGGIGLIAAVALYATGSRGTLPF